MEQNWRNLLDQLAPGRWVLFLLLVGGVVGVAFSPILANGWVHYDDPQYILENPLLGADFHGSRLKFIFTDSVEGNWIPFTWLSFILIDEFFGKNPAAFHAASLGLHVCNSLLAALILRKLKFGWSGCVILALIWALHPHKVESVAWATALKDLLSGLFGFVSIAFLLHSDRRRFLVLAWLAFLLSLAAKPALVTLPVLLLGYDFFNSHEKKRSILWKRWHWWLASMAAGIATLIANRGRSELAESVSPHSLQDYLHRGISSLGHQVSGFFYPEKLIPEYLRDSATNVSFLAGCLFIAVVASLGGLYWKRRRGRFQSILGPVTLSLADFIVLLLPFLGFIPSPMEYTADRLSYLPSFFLVVGLGMAVRALPIDKQVSGLVGVIPVVLCAKVSQKQIAHWKSGASLDAHMLQVVPNHPTALENRGVSRAMEGDWEGAFQDFHAVTLLHPSRASAWANAVRCLAQMNRLEEALQFLVEGRKLHPNERELNRMRGVLAGANGSY